MVLKSYRYVFFHAVSPNITLTFPTNTEHGWLSILKEERRKFLAQVSKGFIP